MQRRLYIDTLHTAQDIFCFAVFLVIEVIEVDVFGHTILYQKFEFFWTEIPFDLDFLGAKYYRTNEVKIYMSSLNPLKIKRELENGA